jgi:UDP-glucuronate decarboxylase
MPPPPSRRHGGNASASALPPAPASPGGTVLVAGGAGFIGSHLVEALLRRGRRVVCLDNLQTGGEANLSHLLPRGAGGTGVGDLTLVRHDVTLPLPPLPRVAEIYNLACAASPPQYQRDPVHTMKTNVLGAIHLLELAEACGATILQASTSEVYGDPDVHPQPEDYRGNVNPVGPRACYDEGKRAAETLFFDFARTRGVRVKVARLFNTYGPRMAEDDGRVVSNLIAQALRGEPLTVYGDGRQTRSLCYVDDMVRALLALMGSGDGVAGPLNLGNPEELTVLELARRVLSLTGSASPVAFLPLPVDDPRRRRPAIGRAVEQLGWRPRVGSRRACGARSRTSAAASRRHLRAGDGGGAASHRRCRGLRLGQRCRLARPAGGGTASCPGRSRRACRGRRPAMSAAEKTADHDIGRRGADERDLVLPRRDEAGGGREDRSGRRARRVAA